MNTKVSICIPTYNRKDFLKEALDSVFAQTYQDFDVVIVDDGSTDGTRQMIKEINFPIRYYWQQNSGDAAARNKLIQLAKGEFIIFLDSDDLLIPDAVERILRTEENENDEVIVYGNYLRIDECGNICGRSTRKLHSGYITPHLFKDIIVHPSGSMFPKRILEEARGFDESLPFCSDYDLWLSLSTKYRFIALIEATYKRRRHAGNLSARSMANRIIELKVLERFYYKKEGVRVVPKGIAVRRLSKEAYRVGILALVNFVGILSMNLAIFNIIPFPALDGGRLAFIFLEKLIGRKIMPKAEAVAHAIGMVVLIILLIAITAHDIRGLISAGSISNYLEALNPN